MDHRIPTMRSRKSRDVDTCLGLARLRDLGFGRSGGACLNLGALSRIRKRLTW